MKQIRLLKWLLEVDINKTKEFYSKDRHLCDCIYCGNYVEVSKTISSPLLEIFETLGIDPTKPSHVDEFGEMDGGLRLYIGHYHVVGKIIEGEYCTDSDWNETNTAELENYRFGFQKDLLFVPDDIPTPVLQLEFETRLPWLLGEEPED